MHIEIQNCFSFWGTSSPRPHNLASPQDTTGGLLSPRPPAQDVPPHFVPGLHPWFDDKLFPMSPSLDPTCACRWLNECLGSRQEKELRQDIIGKMGSSAVADKLRKAFVQMQWRG